MLKIITILGATFGLVFGAARIIGGEEADISEVPYQLSLQTESGQHFCGAILISEKWALTAAQCLYGISNQVVKTLQVRAGSGLYDVGGQVVKLKRAILHPNFSFETFNNDIALINFVEAVTVDTAQAAVLPEQGSNIQKEAELTVSGWGVIDVDSDELSRCLQVVQVPYVCRDICRDLYAAANSVVTDNMFCAGNLEEGGQDSCSGDAGGPASRNGRVLGIVSWGVSCADPSFPGVYTQISRYRNWIRQIARV